VRRDVAIDGSEMPAYGNGQRHLFDGAWNVRTARENESVHAVALLDATRARGFAAETCAMDKGYHLATVYDACEDRNCRPIITLRPPRT